MHLKPLSCLFFACSLGGLALPVAAHADAVSDALDAAVAAYADGDLNGTSAQISTAGKELAKLQSGLLLAVFPAAPDGWTRSENTDMAEGMAMLGGGAGAEVTYTDASGNGVAVSAYADSGMVQTFAGILANPAMMAMMGKVVQINGVDFLEQEGNATMALVDNRVLLQASGDPARAQEILGLFDLTALAAFDKN